MTSKDLSAMRVVVCFLAFCAKGLTEGVAGALGPQIHLQSGAIDVLSHIDRYDRNQM